jgi:hypothetical protein
MKGNRIYFLLIGSDKGQYLLLSSAFTSQLTTIAVIQSETFTATSRAGRCLTFWYVMRGNQLGHIEISISNDQGSAHVWSLGTIDQGDSWHFASVGYYSDIDYNVN